MKTQHTTRTHTYLGRSFQMLTHQATTTLRRAAWLTCRGVLPLVLLGVLALVPQASAVVADHSGTICKNYNASEVSFIDYFAYGTRSLKGSATPVICPVARNTSNGNGAFVYVDLTTFGTQTVSCTAYSYNFNGALLASASGSWTGSGFHEFALNLSGAGKSNAWSNYSALCTIPGSGNAVIYDVDLIEN